MDSFLNELWIINDSGSWRKELIGESYESWSLFKGNNSTTNNREPITGTLPGLWEELVVLLNMSYHRLANPWIKFL
jgi:hypothetical protein